jgi:hypothetical protein
MGNLILGFRTPTLPLLPLWEKGVGGMRGTMRLPSVYPIRRGISTV